MSTGFLGKIPSVIFTKLNPEGSAGMFQPWDYSESNISQFILEVMGKSQGNIENQNCSPSSCLSPKLLYYLFTRCHVSGKRTTLRETYMHVIRLNILPKATLFIEK